MRAAQLPTPVQRRKRSKLTAILIGLAIAGSIAAPVEFFIVSPALVLGAWLLADPLRSRLDATFWLVAAFTAWTAVSLNWAVNPDAGGLFRSFLPLPAMLLLIRWTLSTLSEIVIAAVGYLLGTSAILVRLLFGDSESYIASNLVRYTVEGFNANYISYTAVVALAMLVLSWRSLPPILGRVMALAVVGIIVASVVLTQSRGSLVSIALVVVWLAICFLLKTPPLRLFVGGVVAVAVLIGTGLNDALFLLLETSDRASGDLAGRLTVWPTARGLWNEEFFIGHGFRAVRFESQGGLDAHNAILEIGSSTGLVGVVLFVLFLVSILGLWRLRNMSRSQRVIVGAFVAAASPAILTGAWEFSNSAWMAFAIFAAYTRVLATSDAIDVTSETGDERSALGRRWDAKK